MTLWVGWGWTRWRSTFQRCAWFTGLTMTWGYTRYSFCSSCTRRCPSRGCTSAPSLSSLTAPRSAYSNILSEALSFESSPFSANPLSSQSTQTFLRCSYTTIRAQPITLSSACSPRSSSHSARPSTWTTSCTHPSAASLSTCWRSIPSLYACISTRCRPERRSVRGSLVLFVGICRLSFWGGISSRESLILCFLAFCSLLIFFSCLTWSEWICLPMATFNYNALSIFLSSLRYSLCEPTGLPSFPSAGPAPLPFHPC